MKVMGWGARLMLIQVFFIFIVWLSGYYPGLEVLFALFYLYLIWKAGQVIGSTSSRFPFRNILLAGLIAQFPGFLLTVANIYYLIGNKNIAEDYTFSFQLWHTPFMPFLSFYSFPVYSGYVFYFLFLFILSPIYVLILIISYMSSVKKIGPF